MSLQRTIHLKTSAGLANRLRSIDSAVNFALILDAELHVTWPENDALAGAFEDLFQRPTAFTVSTMNPQQGRFKRLKHRLAVFSGLTATFRGPMPETLRSITTKTSANFLLSLPLDRCCSWCRHYIIDTDHAFCYPENYSWLEPALELQL